MLKNLIYFLGLCSFIHATHNAPKIMQEEVSTLDVPEANINVVKLGLGAERSSPITCVVIDATNKTLNEFQADLNKIAIDKSSNSYMGLTDNISANLFIGLDGKITCFVPDNKILEKFDDSIRSLTMGSGDAFIDVGKNYDSLADYLMNSSYRTRLDDIGGWKSQKPYCNFSINIMLERKIVLKNTLDKSTVEDIVEMILNNTLAKWTVEDIRKMVLDNTLTLYSSNLIKSTIRIVLKNILNKSTVEDIVEMVLNNTLNESTVEHVREIVLKNTLDKSTVENIIKIVLNNTLNKSTVEHVREMVLNNALNESTVEHVREMVLNNALDKSTVENVREMFVKNSVAKWTVKDVREMFLKNILAKWTVEDIREMFLNDTLAKWTVEDIREMFLNDTLAKWIVTDIIKIVLNHTLNKSTVENIKEMVLNNILNEGTVENIKEIVLANTFDKSTVLLEKILDNEKLQNSHGYTDTNLYEDQQIDVVYNVLKALTKRGIQKENILGYADVALSHRCFRPYSSFWRQFYERHEGFFFVPTGGIHLINDCTDLSINLLKIGYTDSNNQGRPDLCFWICYAVNAVALRYLPSSKHHIKSRSFCDSKPKEKLYRDLRDSYPKILEAIYQVANYDDNHIFRL